MVSIGSAKTSSADAQIARFVKALSGMLMRAPWSSQWPRLAKKSGLHYSTIRNIANGTTVCPDIKTFQKLLPAMGLPPLPLDFTIFEIGKNEVRLRA